MLVGALRIGRQSIYDTFGDKWQIYLASVRRYVGAETRAHADMEGRATAGKLLLIP